MCGFAGFLSHRIDGCSKDARQAVLRRMSHALAHRGPDDEAFYLDDALSFVFRRLSIIDVAGGTQPIWNEDRSMFVAVNGEIYNHRDLRRSLEATHAFRTQSDSEVVLHLFEEHGLEAFSMLNGMYAIVLWNSRERRLVLARDRLGIKPLYYAELDEGLLFGSELKGLLMHPACPRELDWTDLMSVGLSQRSQVPTYVKGVRHLPAGGYVSVESNGSLELGHYWRIEQRAARSQFEGDAAACIDQYEALLVDSVRRQLMSDVPIGLFLSGGIDSSLIAAIAAKSGAQFHCFSFAEENTYLSGDLQDSVRVTDELRLPHHPVYFDLKTLLAEINFDLATLEHFVWMMDSPRFDLEFLFKHEIHRFVRTRYPAVKVVLLGQGADEFAGGYSGLQEGNYKNWNDYLTRSVDPGVRQTWAINRDIPHRFAALLHDPQEPDDGGFRSYRRRMQGYYYQMQHFNLWHEDRTSSSQGREARVPFLDHALVEFAMSIPEALQPDLFWDKRIVREAMARQLPSYSKSKRKIPFFVTEQRQSIQKFALSILTKIFPAFCDKYLADSAALFERNALQRLVDRGQRSGGADEEAVWCAMEAICVQIFVHQLADAATDSAPWGQTSSSPLLELSVEQRSDLDRCFVSKKLPHAFEFAPGVRFAAALPKDPASIQLLVFQNEELAGKFKLPSATHWALRWLEKPTALTSPWTIDTVAREMGAAESDVAGFVQGLRERGFVH